MKYLEVEGARRPEAEGRRRRAGQHVEVTSEVPRKESPIRLVMTDELVARV